MENSKDSLEQNWIFCKTSLDPPYQYFGTQKTYRVSKQFPKITKIGYAKQKSRKIKKMARWRFWNVFSILPIFSDSFSMKCFKIPISLRKLTLILRFLLKMKLLKFVSRMKVVFFESVKEKEKELSHTLIIEQMCRNERVFQLFPPISWWGCAAKKVLVTSQLHILSII